MRIFMREILKKVAVSKGDSIKFFNRYSPFKYMQPEKLENTQWKIEDFKTSKHTGKPLAVILGGGQFHTLDKAILENMISKGRAKLQ